MQQLFSAFLFSSIMNKMLLSVYKFYNIQRLRRVFCFYFNSSFRTLYCSSICMFLFMLFLLKELFFLFSFLFIYFYVDWLNCSSVCSYVSPFIHVFIDTTLKIKMPKKTLIEMATEPPTTLHAMEMSKSMILKKKRFIKIYVQFKERVEHRYCFFIDLNFYDF